MDDKTANNLPTQTPSVPDIETPSSSSEPKVTESAKPPEHHNHKRFIIIMSLLFILLAGATAAYWYFKMRHIEQPTNTQTTTQQTETKKVEGLQLDPHKNYGNKYANGILPVGDKKYTTDAAKKGNIYMCYASFVAEGQAGAITRGPWFISTTQYDINKKVAVQGKINWTPQYSMTIKDGKRVVVTNDLPNHYTGKFPVAATDPAHSYDRNPNSISAQSLTYNLNSSPTYGTPQCMGGEVGIMNTGSAIFNGFDAGGRDAGAWEVQDSCDGHPQNKGEYHYHTLSRCITDVSVSKVIGFALDGYPITGPKVGDNNLLTTEDLDECHGIVSDVQLDGITVNTYHYVMTQDFPYSVSCFRSTAIQAPGLPETTGDVKAQNGTPPPHQ